MTHPTSLYFGSVSGKLQRVRALWDVLLYIGPQARFHVLGVVNYQVCMAFCQPSRITLIVLPALYRQRMFGEGVSQSLSVEGFHFGEAIEVDRVALKMKACTCSSGGGEYQLFHL